jgi:phage tail-like protein
MSGTSWLLGSGYPWHSASDPSDLPGVRSAVVVANDNIGLSLATLPDSSLGLTAADGSLGRLTLPLGVAVNKEDVFILSQDGTLVYHYDSAEVTLTPLRYVGAQDLSGTQDDDVYLQPRCFRGATNIAALRGELYVADPAAHRVQVFDLRNLALLRIHGGFADPIDVAASNEAVYILDRGAGRVWRAEPGTDCLSIVAEPTDTECRSRRWDRVAVDTEERVYLRFRGASSVELDVFHTRDCPYARHEFERIYDSAQVRDRFAPPAITSDGSGGCNLPPNLLDPCGLRKPLADSVPRWEFGGRLYVADPATLKLRVFLPDGRRRQQFGPLDSQSVEVSPDSDDVWAVSDMVALGGCVLILDSRHQVVYSHRNGDALLRRWFGAPGGSDSNWHRIAADSSGCILLWDGSSDTADRFDARGASRGTVQVRAVRALFNRPRSTRQPSTILGRVRLTRSGAIPRPSHEPLSWPKAEFYQTGTWTSDWLDSGIYNCAWDVIELSGARMPAGSSIVVRTRTSNARQSIDEMLATADTVGSLGSWSDTPALVGAPQPDPNAPETFNSDVLIPSGAGQYLQLQLVLTGNGTATPLIRNMRLRFPRDSLLQYLPAVYSSPPAQRDFLDRYLSILQRTWSGIELNVDTFSRYLDPDSVPDPYLPWLAGWLNVRLEGTWTAAQNRRLLKAVPGLRKRWGTVAGMRDWLRVYLANLAQISPDDLEKLGIPGIVESFVERRRLRLADGGATLCETDALWSPSVERRFQVGVFDREGEIEVVSTGDPQLDVFQRYAHAFRVYVPSLLVRGPDDESLLRRAVELQKPAHATYDLILVEPRFRLGDQSTLELDTVIGAPLPGPLMCPELPEAPSRPPHQRLSFDTTLGGRCGSDSSRLERTLA